MKTLDDAWKWYLDVKNSLHRIKRMGQRYWELIPWDTPPWQSDRHFLELSQTAVVDAAEHGSQHLDDLAVVVLFSVFEANVRGGILEQVLAEEDQYQHQAIRDAIASVKERIGEGSFYAVLSFFKGTAPHLIEQVNQVRKYRNWVSHGRRGLQPAVVTPHAAYARLTQGMSLFFPPIPADWVAIGAYYLWESEMRSGAKDVIHWNKAKMKLQDLVRTGQLTLPES